MQLDLEAKEQFEKRFRIISLLGKGSFGYVYQCEDLQDLQIYAVKVICKNNVKRSKIECLREEAKILKTIDHSNIVKVYEFVESNTFIFLKMEIIKNGTLQKLIKKRWENGQKFTDDEIATIMGAIFKAVNHIHSVSIIHRDIKPDNILLANWNKLTDLKIADFGLSTKLDFHYPKTATSKCGTMLFMAPEILCNYTYTKSVDIWSCCIIMYMLYTGKHPFYEPKMSTEDYKRKIKSVKFSALPHKLAQDFLTRISKIEPNERYTTQQALKHPWLTRNFEDQIPLSLHQSFSSFQKSHEISHLIKTMTILKQVFLGTAQKIPQSYLLKQQYFLKENYSVGLVKSKSKQSARDLQSLNDLNATRDREKDKQNKQKLSKKSAEVENDNPTIMKLNSIFNSLFGKRSKLQLKPYTQGVVHIAKQNTMDLPDISDIKEKIECQIERAVVEFKNNLKQGRKRILPNRQTPMHSENYIKDELKVDLKMSSNNYKVRYRKKNTALKLYE